MNDVYDKLVSDRLGDRAIALCIVVHTQGSTPRARGAKMLVYSDGKISGTIGGGRLEKKIIGDALEVLKGTEPRIVHYDLVKQLQMCCGGAVDIYIEPLAMKNRLYIFGAGHTGLALAKRAAGFDFEVTVFDDRAEYLDEIADEGIRKVHCSFSESLPDIPFDERTYIAIMTYSHPVDRKILSFCLQKKYAYLGMIGSRRKIEVTKRLFEEEGIGSPEQLEAVDMPMGIDIGAEGPDEISVSILAKLLSVKNKVAIT